MEKTEKVRKVGFLLPPFFWSILLDLPFFCKITHELF